MRVYVLLYNPGTDNEGIHSIRIGNKDIILMFESEDDATRYALLLEAQDFQRPSVEPIDSQEVEEFCKEAGYEWKLVTEGMLEIPPERNLEETDWKPEQQEGKMSEEELEKIRRRLEGLL
ncbi:MAG: DUF3110 domain-containing protein [Geminocystis sp.]|nr:DUF3110 domain-containing protein [Geminocystis sp.]HIK36651.1 DUF3110 domain-containing protein [Geminocystis sp. M7585_C2015_104]MCS7147894.1 DUF3110 domain-containing protein [Geminocystis sp.]MCX8078720.1 DUF3110 domain-containing protein [Geminocystis sp.]MDW8117018.1 DUF3110 domain-containing protein [Geminocystis sp.]